MNILGRHSGPCYCPTRGLSLASVLRTDDGTLVHGGSGVAFREHISRVALQCCTACSQLEACCVRNVPRPVFRGSCRVPCSACISMFCHLCSVGSGRVLPASCRSMPAVCFITAGPIRPLEGTPCTVVYPNPFERHLNQMSYRRDTQGPHSNPGYHVGVCQMRQALGIALFCKTSCRRACRCSGDARKTL